MTKHIIAWHPIHEVAARREDMDRVFDSLFGRVPAESARREGPWLPLVDIEENGDQITVRAEVPGLTKDDIKVSVVGNNLALSGERKHECEENGKTFHRIERTYGKFHRLIALPSDVDNSKVKAQYRDGILTIVLPKAEKDRKREVSIEVN